MSLTNDDFDRIESMLTGAVSGLATKAELTGLANKADLAEAVSGLATKAELADAVSGLATKAELAELAGVVSGLATKSDLHRTESRILASMGLLERDTDLRLDEHELRITRLEKGHS